MSRAGRLCVASGVVLLLSAPSVAAGARFAGAQAVPARAVALSGRCHQRGTDLYSLPDAHCTPGALNPAVTQATIYRTICVSGWSASVRPPESYTEPLKEQQMAAYGNKGRLGAYEEDHLVPLELGGSPTSPGNLWPEPGAAPNPKDAVEDAAHAAVCGQRISLAAARRAIATNWIAFGERLGVFTATDVRENRRIIPHW